MTFSTDAKEGAELLKVRLGLPTGKCQAQTIGLCLGGVQARARELEAARDKMVMDWGGLGKEDIPEEIANMDHRIEDLYRTCADLEDSLARAIAVTPTGALAQLMVAYETVRIMVRENSVCDDGDTTELNWSRRLDACLSSAIVVLTNVTRADLDAFAGDGYLGKEFAEMVKQRCGLVAS